MGSFKSQALPSGVAIEFGPDKEYATNTVVQRRLLEGEPTLRKQIEAKIQAAVLDIRRRFDLQKEGEGVVPSHFVALNTEVDDVYIQVRYDHVSKRLQALVVMGYARELSAVCDFDDASVGNVEFKPSTLLYTPEKAAKRGAKPAAAPTPAAPSNAPRLTGGALKA